MVLYQLSGFSTAQRCGHLKKPSYLYVSAEPKSILSHLFLRGRESQTCWLFEQYKVCNKSWSNTYVLSPLCLSLRGVCVKIMIIPICEWGWWEEAKWPKLCAGCQSWVAMSEPCFGASGFSACFLLWCFIYSLSSFVSLSSFPWE